MNDRNAELPSCASLCTMDERETALLSVSVTFKPQENLDTDADKPESKTPDQAVGKDDSVGHTIIAQEEESLNNSDCRGTTPSGPITSSESKIRDGETGIRTKNKASKEEILPGWKGFSNSIYIQPIIVNSPRNKNCSELGKCTVEHLRQRLRLRQSSEWVVKHNQRIHLKGSLKTGVSNLNSEINTSSTETENPEPSHPEHSYPVKKTSKLAKGFVCRHWARDFLLNENESQQESQPSSLTVRSYVNVNMMDTLLKTAKASRQKKGLCSDMVRSPQLEKGGENPTRYDDGKGHQISRRSSLSSSEVMPKDNLHKVNTDMIFGSISVNLRNSCTDDACTCSLNDTATGTPATETHRKEKEKARNMLKSRRETRIFMPVPLKEFPPIDPLRDLKMSAKFQTMGKRRLPRRPHTVGTPCSFSHGSGKQKAETSRISSSKSLDRHFRGIHGKAVEPPLKNCEDRGKSSETVVVYLKP